MIDFYKHSILSILGQEAGTLSEKEFTKEIVNNYDEYLEKLQKVKLKMENVENNN